MPVHPQPATTPFPPGPPRDGHGVVTGRVGASGAAGPLDVAAFTRVAAALAAAARRAGLAVPAFRSPPRSAAARRTIRRIAGGPVVAVRRGARPAVEVVADLVDGVLAANGLRPTVPFPAATDVFPDPASVDLAVSALRRLLLAESLAALGPIPGRGPSSRLAGAARVAERQTQAA